MIVYHVKEVNAKVIITKEYSISLLETLQSIKRTYGTNSEEVVQH